MKYVILTNRFTVKRVAALGETILKLDADGDALLSIVTQDALQADILW